MTVERERDLEKQCSTVERERDLEKQCLTVERERFGETMFDS